MELIIVAGCILPAIVIERTLLFLARSIFE